MDTRTPPPISLLIAEDHQLVRRALVSILSLEPGVRIAGEAADGAEAIRLALGLRPDVVLMDIDMPRVTGIEAAAEVTRILPAVKILILSAHPDDALVFRAVDAGASGYVLKNATREELTAAIRAVHSGQRFFSSSLSRVVVERVAARTSPPPGDGGGDGSRMTPREREILKMITEGRTHREVAGMLNISVRTVDTHCNHVMKKLDLHGIAELTAYAIRNGLHD